MSTPTTTKPPTPRFIVTRQRAQFASELCVATHELKQLEQALKDKQRLVERLSGAVESCEVLLPQLPADEPGTAREPEGKSADKA